MYVQCRITFIISLLNNDAVEKDQPLLKMKKNFTSMTKNSNFEKFWLVSCMPKTKNFVCIKTKTIIAYILVRQLK